jgi:D-alanyl-D-alanine carboxypeptidase/D-alanyl-D-alanine-endopeptidase (penicillin-binding protein 4)
MSWGGRACPLLAAALFACGCGPQQPAVVPAAAVAAISSERLKSDLDALLAAPQVAQGTWGVLVRSLTRADTLYSTNSNKLLLPSSTMKILTLAAAAERLGWDFTFETRLVGASRVEGGGLGPLTVVGGGDPTIDNWDGAASRLFQEWAGALKSAGIRSIEGDIIGDDNAFDDEALGAGWMWDDLDRSFATGIGALQFNENTAQVILAPGLAIGDDALITSSQPTSGLLIKNLVKTGAPGSPLAIATERRVGDPTLEVRGSIALGSFAVVRNVSVLNPTLYFVNELRAGLVENGIDVRGAAFDVDEYPGVVSAGTPLVDHRSPPLTTVAATMMKLSQNLYAETLLRTLGVTAGMPTARGGIDAVRGVLSAWGISESGYSQADGSGLSRYNVVTAETLVGVLTHVNQDDRLREPFVAALPVAGRDGTLENRMKGTRAEGNARAKTGSMIGARGLAGFVSTADGEPLVFAILTNNYGQAAEAVDRTLDAIVVRLAEFSRATARGSAPAAH